MTSCVAIQCVYHITLEPFPEDGKSFLKLSTIHVKYNHSWGRRGRDRMVV